MKEKDKCWKMIVVGKQKSVSQKYKNNKSVKIITFTISPTKIITKYTHVLIHACNPHPTHPPPAKKSVIDKCLQTSTWNTSNRNISTDINKLTHWYRNMDNTFVI